MDKTIINRNFSRSAGSYNENAFVQSACAGILAGYLAGRDHDRILEIGCGTGAYTRELRRLFPKAAITALDMSPDMLRAAAGDMAGEGIEFIERDCEQYDDMVGFGLITSNAAIHWLSDPVGAIRKLVPLVSPGGDICFSIYGPGTFTELRDTVKECLGEERDIASSRFMSGGTIKEVLTGYFDLVEMEKREFAIEFPSLFELMRNIKRTGTRGAGISGVRTLDRGMIRKMEKTMIRRYGRVIASHHVYFLNARGRRA
ncbi:MAG: methyltransferase domain-containing protein [Candidatus Omnitrophica bacterium]|nr:methyltransferase domain-containing protein [Candidatus Omnitrophota bacterium]